MISRLKDRQTHNFVAETDTRQSDFGGYFKYAKGTNLQHIEVLGVSAYPDPARLPMRQAKCTRVTEARDYTMPNPMCKIANACTEGSVDFQVFAITSENPQNERSCAPDGRISKQDTPTEDIRSFKDSLNAGQSKEFANSAFCVVVAEVVQTHAAGHEETADEKAERLQVRVFVQLMLV